MSSATRRWFTIAFVVATASLPLRGQSATIARLKKIPPVEAHDVTCADVGRGGVRQNGSFARVDTVTDLLKNRVDEGAYERVAVSDILSLPWEGLATRRYAWQRKDSAMVATYESAAVLVDGYLVAIKEEGKEATNCGIDDPEWHDWHLWLVETEAEAHDRDKTRAVVIEITPRVRTLRASQGAFDKAQLQQWARSGQKVRVSGWLLFDPDHPDQVGKSRGTTWEVHPVMKIEAAP